AVQAGKEKAARQAEIEKLAPEIAKLAAKDVNVKKELKIASELLGHKDIFSELETLERELSQIARERSSSGGSQKEVDPSKTGFFQKLKLAAEAAAAGIANTAKEAQLKLRESSATFKYEAASKQLALLLARELRERDFTNARLVPLTKKAAAAGVALEHWTAEETSALKEMERYAPLA
ncbi:hypothetical protein HY251_01795, partial [bacterium]|nr:hypothetical protein [bacterium]